MECKYCGYWWQDSGESYPQCHYEGPAYWAPCELDYYEPEDYYGD